MTAEELAAIRRRPESRAFGPDYADIEKLCSEVERLQAAIRKHRDERGDDRCWLDDWSLYKSLPEGYTPPVLDSSVEIENCRRFIACRKDPGTTYVSPQRRIEQLEGERDELRSKLGEAMGRLDIIAGNVATTAARLRGCVAGTCFCRCRHCLHEWWGLPDSECSRCRTVRP